MPHAHELDATAPLLGSPPSVAELEGRKSRRATLTAAAVLLLISAFGSVAFLTGHGGAYLHLVGESGVVEGQLTILVDGEEAYSRRLAASGIGSLIGRSKNRTFETHIEVEGGVHGVAAVIVDGEGVLVHEEDLMIDVRPGEIRELKVTVSGDSGSSPFLRAD